MKVREGGRVRNVPLLVAVGVNAAPIKHGHREFLGIQVNTGETHPGWRSSATWSDGPPGGGAGALRRSAHLVRHASARSQSLLSLSVLVAAAIAFVNIVAGIGFAFTLPFIGLVMTYAYLDARIADELQGPDRERGPLPAESELRPGPEAHAPTRRFR